MIHGEGSRFSLTALRKAYWLVFGVGAYPADGGPSRGGLGAGVVLGGVQALPLPLAAEVSRSFGFVEAVEEAGGHEIELQCAFLPRP